MQQSGGHWSNWMPQQVPLEVAACLFGGTALLAAWALFRMGDGGFARPGFAGSSPMSAGMQKRRYLVAFLFVANLSRCFSLLAELSFEEEPVPLLHDWNDAQMGWLSDLVALLPAVIFLSAFSVVVLFWAQLHWTTNIVPVPMLDCIFVCVNIACFLLVATIALVTFLLEAYDHLRTYMICIIGFLNAVVAVSFLYFGYMVASELQETARKKLLGKQLTHRVLILSVVCSAALLTRGICYLAWGFSLGKPTWRADLALCFVGEWLPSAVALVVLSPSHQSGARSPTDSVEDSTDSEAPLLQDDAPTPHRALTGGAQTWKQLYPAPEKA